eukprot:CAMPEP_0197040212 /NCGR_PEP_ID=MMETSP1384-20130603/16955_1 /TAXON_ID=29189 /ORGANISM="Ammonia sp." /LENGTH=64 /DNA_ID=CAMNT_0042470939 /DNA_START=161 /DNA_END=355 /DNA_ORIENTATION=-
MTASGPELNLSEMVLSRLSMSTAFLEPERCPLSSSTQSIICRSQASDASSEPFFIPALTSLLNA